MSMFRIRRWLVLSVALVAALAGVAYWLASTESALGWLAREVSVRSQGRIALEGAQGSLLGTVRFARIEYRDPDVTVVATDAAASASLRALLDRSVRLAGLEAAEVHVAITRSDGPATVPADIGLRFEVVADRVRARKLTLDLGGDRIELAEVDGAYSGDATRHTVRIAHAVTPWGTAKGETTLGAPRPFPITGNVRIERTAPAPSYAADVKLTGSLEALELSTSGVVGSVAAEGTARLAPFADRWLDAATLRATDVDLAKFDATLPRTALDATLTAGADREGRLRGTVAATNRAPGPVSAEKLPLASVEADFALADGALALSNLRADLGAAGRASGSGRIALDGTSRWNLSFAPLDLRGLHAQLRSTKLAGTLVAELGGDAQRFDANLREAGIAIEASVVRLGDRIEAKRIRAAAEGGELVGSGQLSLDSEQRFSASAVAARFDPSRFGDWPQATLNGDLEANGQLAPQPSADVKLVLRDSRLRGVPLSGGGEARVSSDRMENARIDLALGANTLRAAGALGRVGDRLALSLDAPKLAEIDRRFAGKLTATGTLGDTFTRPSATFDARGESIRALGRYRADTLAARGEISADEDRTLKLDASATGIGRDDLMLSAAQATATGSVARHRVTLRGKSPDADFEARVEGSWRAKDGWSGMLTQFDNRGLYPVSLEQPASIAFAPERFSIEGVAARVLEGRVTVDTLDYRDGRLVSRGAFSALPARPLALLAGLNVARGSTFTLRGDWTVTAAPRLNGIVRIAREAGDLLLPGEPSLALGIDELAVDARLAEDAVSLTGSLRAQKLGEAKLAADITPPPGAEPGSISGDASLVGTLTADVASLRLIDELTGTTALVDGRAQLALAMRGTLAAPLVTGTLAGDALRVEMPQYGLFLKDGTVRATLDERVLRIDSAQIRGPEGVLTASGVVARRGAEGDSRIEWRADKLRVFNRPDRRLVVTGDGSVALAGAKVVLRGNLRADEGYIEFGRAREGRLGEDVVVLGRPEAAERRARQPLPLDIDVTLDPGTRFNIAGEGLEAALLGKVRVQTTPDGRFVAKGEIETARGIYTAFGQRLEIERGRLIFDGPIDNPGLDIRALRRNQPVEAGVELTGTVKVPQVRLVSNPPVPDAEKLSWLVAGRGLENASAADLTLIQAAASTLIGSDQATPISRRVARQFGLDDITVRGATGTTSGSGVRGTTSGQVVAFGKRLSDRLYLEYEQGVTFAANIVRLNFQLTRTIGVRAETGTGSGIGVSYSRSYD